MKRTVVVLTMLLALTMTLCGDVLSKITPDNYVDPGLLKVQDEDHPWGGDQTNGGGNDGTDVNKDYIGSFATDIDFGVFGLIYKMWFYRNFNTNPITTNSITTSITTTNTNTSTNSGTTIGTGSLTTGTSGSTSFGTGTSR